MITYTEGKGLYKNWLLCEDEFQLDKLGKCETIMALGNGYMGSRFTCEENYLNQKRDTFINGTFNKFSEYEVSELPNLPDMWEMELYFDGYRFSLEKGELLDYKRILNLKDDHASRDITWRIPNGKIVKLHFGRFVSFADRHTFATKLSIHSDEHVDVMIKSGINAQHTNSGSQHLDEVDMRFFDKRYLQFNVRTTHSRIGISCNTTHRVSCEDVKSEMFMDRRIIRQILKFEVHGDAEVEKISNYYTEVDVDLQGMSFDDIKKHAYHALQKSTACGYDALCAKSMEAWHTQINDQYPIIIDSEHEEDQLAIRFAIYHLSIMTPKHDHRMGIAAKGMTGEGYKGHSFWDTEVFILPFFIYNNPQVARSLLEYRYLGLEGARKKAAENGFEGAMYPWEAAWPKDGEVTPVWGAVDIISGEQTKIWSGFIEQHITSDIANAVWQYYIITDDQQFMDDYGYEILFDTAIFWASRLEYNAEKDCYEINDVVGPDEYKEHVDNNAFTNYMAMHNMKLALRYAEEIVDKETAVYERLNKKLNLEVNVPVWKERLQKIYLPQPNEELIIPQDDTYLSKTIIDLAPYKAHEQVATLFQDYNLEQVNDMQVSKQADIMILFYLLEDLFTNDVKIANYNYYEPKTTHDSSLSLSTHSILASDLNDTDKAYALFRRASQIDMGTNMDSSDYGIHAASLGGVWQCIVMGFAGVRMLNEMLRIDPKLPAYWKHLAFNMYWQGSHLHVELTHDTLHITSEDDHMITFTCCGVEHQFRNEIEVAYA